MMDENSRQSLSWKDVNDHLDRWEQYALERQVRELKKDPRNFARTTIFSESVSQNEIWFDAGEDESGNEVSFGYSVGRNIAGFFLTFKVASVKHGVSGTVIECSNFQPHKKRKLAKRLSAERADKELERKGLNRRWSIYYEKEGE